MKISEVLLNRRKELKLSLDALSKKTGISCCSLIKYEKGKIYPTVSNLRRLADALKLDYDAVYDILSKEKKGN